MNDNKTFPFTQDQLTKLREELDQAGSFTDLMVSKKGISLKKGTEYITLYNDIEKYKTKHLIGVYEPLREFYDTEMPYAFWSEMYKVLLRVERQNNQ